MWVSHTCAALADGYVQPSRGEIRADQEPAMQSASHLLQVAV